MRAACVNPAALEGGPGKLKAYLLSGRSTIVTGLAAEAPVWAKGLIVTTPFVSVPELLSAECVTTAEFDYLAITVHADPAGPRIHDITGDVIVHGTVLPQWGLHLIDPNLTMGNLLDIVGAEADTWIAKAAK